ncbi:MAG: DUF192 domain-containing protein [Candidatus Omnitrophota bacterium]|nr:DUF192 domain-containing protein [Candidatus Omnitrophota bacterium]
MKVINTSKNTILADNVKPADTFLKRLIGLLNRKALNKGEALILSPSNSIHSLFMRFTIDVIFLDKTNKVIAALPSFKPFRLSPVYFNASLTIELPEGAIQSTHTQPGDIIKII